MDIKIQYNPKKKLEGLINKKAKSIDLADKTIAKLTELKSEIIESTAVQAMVIVDKAKAIIKEQEEVIELASKV